MKSFATRAVAVAAVGIAAGMTLLESSAAHGSGPQWTAEPTSSAPAPVVVPGCEAGCRVVFSVPLAGGAHLDGLAPSVEEEPSAGMLVYWAGGKLVDRRGLSDVQPRPGDLPRAGACSGERCVVSFDTGVHSSAAILLRVDSAGMQQTDELIGDTHGAALVDLDGDGVTDVAIRMSTFDPDYATGPQFWKTGLDRGGKFEVTGCTVPVAALDQPPVRAADGSCLR